MNGLIQIDYKIALPFTRGDLQLYEDGFYDFPAVFHIFFWLPFADIAVKLLYSCRFR